MTVARDDKSADLDGWVTLQNGSGTSFRNAKLQLVAGDLNRVRQAVAERRFDDARKSMEMAAAAPMAQEAFSEYHLYTLGRKTTINNAETKQVSMLDGTGVPVQKRFVVDGQAFYYHNQQHPGAPIKDVVQVYYQFRNDEKAGLGMPMPAGTVRVYQADSKGGVHLAGEDRIGHTPKDETLKLKIGNAFDVVCERNQTRLPEDCQQRLRVRVRDHAAQPQGDSDHRRSQRADRRHLEDGAAVARLDEDRRMGGAVQRARGAGWSGDPEVPRPRYVLSFEP